MFKRGPGGHPVFVLIPQRDWAIWGFCAYSTEILLELIWQGCTTLWSQWNCRFGNGVIRVSIVDVKRFAVMVCNIEKTRGSWDRRTFEEVMVYGCKTQYRLTFISYSGFWRLVGYPKCAPKSWGNYLEKVEKIVKVLILGLSSELHYLYWMQLWEQFSS